MSSPNAMELQESSSAESTNVAQSSIESTSPDKKETISWTNDTISDDKEWDFFQWRVRQDSMFLNLALPEHFDAWWNLIISAYEKPNKKQFILPCIKEMIDSMPVDSFNENHSQWSRYVEGAYLFKQKGIVTEEEFNTCIKLLEEKLTSSYTKAGEYWNIIRTCEKKYIQHDENMYIEKCIESYKKQFSTPYVTMSDDIRKFRKFAKSLEFKINEEDFYSTEKVRELMEEANKYLESFEANGHHLCFEDWITDLLEKIPSQVKRAVALCEETTCDEKDSACYHYMLAKTLCSDEMNKSYETKEINDRLFKALKRGIHLGRYGCDDMIFYYLDYALNAAAKHLNKERVQEIFHDIIVNFDFDDSPEQFFASRKALIFGLKTLIENNKMKVTEFTHRVAEIVSPLSVEGLNLELDWKERAALSNFELKFMELKRLALSCQKELMNTTWTEVLEIWERGVSNLKDPHSFVEYVAFIRESCYPVDIEAAYIKAVKHLEKLNNSPGSSYDTRRCLFLVRKNYREYVAVHGGQINTMKFIEKSSKIQTTSSSVNNERYYLSHHTQIYENNYAYFTSVSSVGEPTPNYEEETSKIPKEMEKLSSNSSSSAEKTSKIPVKEMEKLTVQPYAESQIGYPVFLANINYKASKMDIRKAFKEMGLNVLRIRMGKKYDTGLNYGYARVEFQSEEEASKAIEHERIEILGRLSYVDVCKDKEKNTQPKIEPKVLYVKGLPEEYNTAKVNLLLSQFGHIKTVELQEKTGVIKVEYHIAGDSYVGLLKLQEIFGKQINIRRGFTGQKDDPPQKKAGPSQKKAGPSQRKAVPSQRKAGPLQEDDNATSKCLINQSKKTNGTQLSDSASSETQSVNKQLRSNAFIPQQLRQKMKKKIDLEREENQESVSKAKEETITSSESQSSQDTEDSSPPEKKIRMSERLMGKLTNDDFRKMLKK